MQIQKTPELRSTGLQNAWMLSHVQFFEIPWTVAHQSPLSMGFSKEEYWSGLPFPTRGSVPDSGTKPVSPVSPALAGGSLTTLSPRKPRLQDGAG